MSFVDDCMLSTSCCLFAGSCGTSTSMLVADSVFLFAFLAFLSWLALCFAASFSSCCLRRVSLSSVLTREALRPSSKDCSLKKLNNKTAKPAQIAKVSNDTKITVTSKLAAVVDTNQTESPAKRVKISIVLVEVTLGPLNCQIGCR